jgi:predicted nuclease with TOPRIM domain
MNLVEEIADFVTAPYKAKIKELDEQVKEKDVLIVKLTKQNEELNKQVKRLEDLTQLSDIQNQGEKDD